jgi:hypothetical protein
LLSELGLPIVFAKTLLPGMLCASAARLRGRAAIELFVACMAPRRVVSVDQGESQPLGVTGIVSVEPLIRHVRVQ